MTARTGACPQLVVALALFALVAPVATAQEFEPPRTSWGDPDIGGVWDFRTLTPLERPAQLGDKATFDEEEAEEFRQQTLALRDFDQRRGSSQLDVEGAYNNFWWDWGDQLTADKRTSLIVDPPDGRLPALTETALEMRRAQMRERTPPVRELVSIGANAGTRIRFDGPESLGLSERCLVGFNAGPPMAPSAYNNNVRILQTPDHVVLLNEMVHDARIVPLAASAPDARARHLPQDLRRFMGDSVAHWEGTTLVVDTTNFTGKTPAFQTLGGASGTGETLHLIERFTRVSDSRLLYEYTVDDPATFTRSFTVAIPMRASDASLYEYACHEGNYAMAAVLRGARMEEQEEPSGSSESRP